MVSGRWRQDELGVEHEKRDAAEMVGMKMRDQDGVDRFGVDGQAVERNERGRAAIDQHIHIAPDQMKAGVEPPAGAEGIPAAEELQSQHDLTAVRGSKCGSANGRPHMWTKGERRPPNPVFTMTKGCYNSIYGGVARALMVTQNAACVTGRDVRRDGSA
jgi:hypothetical protein